MSIACSICAGTAINVAGDLVACVVMDSTTPALTSAEEQMEIRETREAMRAQSGQDVLLDP